MSIVQEHMWSVTVTIDGVPVPGVFDTLEGGDIKGDGETYNAGGMAASEALVGIPITEPLTVGRAFRGERDAPMLRSLAGKIGAVVLVGAQALNPDKSPVTDGLITYRGKLDGVTRPKHNSTSKSPAMIELTVLPDGLPS